MASASQVECPYHHKRWRGQVQSLLNVLRGSVLPTRLVRRFPVAVCACVDKGRSTPSGNLDALIELNEWVTQECSGDTALGHARSTLDKLLTSGTDLALTRETRETLVGVVSLIREVHKGNYQMLEYDLHHSPSIESKPLQEELELPISSDHLGVLFGKNGRHIKPLCREYSVTVHFESGSRRSQHNYTSAFGVQATVKYDPGQQGQLEKFKEELRKRADLITLKRKEHSERCETYYKFRMHRQQWRQSGTSKPPGIYQNPKEAAIGQYSRKRQHRPKGPAPKPSFAALSDGHCLHCMAPYTPQELYEGACTFHDGFLSRMESGDNNDYYWTCCNKKTLAHHATHDLHVNTGCTKGRHVWRSGKGSASKGKSTSVNVGNSLGDFYVR